MIQPDDLKKNEPLLWATGKGTDVWKLFCACISGDLKAVKRLLKKDPSLVRTHYAYRTPIYFAVRENQIAVATSEAVEVRDYHSTDSANVNVIQCIAGLSRRHAL